MIRKLLIDANHLAGRSWGAMGDLQTKDGRWSGAIFGFLRGLSYVHKQTLIPYDSMVACWDGGRSAVRKTLYPEYKGGRGLDEDATEEDIARAESYYEQLREIYHCLAICGVPQVRVNGMEADDIASMLSGFYREHGNEVIIYSGDGDFHQLVEKYVKIWDPKRELCEESDILKKWDVDRTDDILFLRALTSDPSDNIFGIKSVGPVRAKLILKHTQRTGSVFEWTINTPSEDLPKKEQTALKYAHSGLDIIKRNLSLMYLPRSLEEGLSYYNSSQIQGVLEELSAVAEPNIPALMAFFEKWDIRDVYLNV